MTTQDIVTDIFELYLDDTSELSSDQELDLADRIYKKVCRFRPWEFLKTSQTGTLSTSVPYVSLPANFAFLAENNLTTDNSVSIENNASPKVVFVGTSYRPYQVVSYSDRRQYLNKDGYAYLDLVNSRLVFTLQPTVADSYEFDYVKVPDTLTLITSPVFPSDFHPMIGYGMAVDGFIIQLFDKARSYAIENQAKYQSYMDDLSYYNAQLRND